MHGLFLHLLRFSGTRFSRTLELCHDFLICLFEICFVLLDSVHFGPDCLQVELFHEIFFLDSFLVSAAYERALALLLDAAYFVILGLCVELLRHIASIGDHEFVRGVWLDCDRGVESAEIVPRGQIFAEINVAALIPGHQNFIHSHYL